MKPNPSLRETQPPIGETTFYPRVPFREGAVVFGRGSTLVIRDQGVPGRAGESEAVERRYEVAVLEQVRQRFAGRTVTVREVFDAVRFSQLRLRANDLPTAYAVRDVLLILCAMGFATADTTSAEPCFTLRARRE